MKLEAFRPAGPFYDTLEYRVTITGPECLALQGIFLEKYGKGFDLSSDPAAVLSGLAELALELKVKE